jgi:hypothetical protein
MGKAFQRATRDAVVARDEVGGQEPAELAALATGLPRPDGGRFYEAWLRNAAALLVPIGTFTTAGTSHSGQVCRRRT